MRSFRIQTCGVRIGIGGDTLPSLSALASSYEVKKSVIFSLKLLCGEQKCDMDSTPSPSSSISSFDFTLGGPELSWDPCQRYWVKIFL